MQMFALDFKIESIILSNSIQNNFSRLWSYLWEYLSFMENMKIPFCINHEKME